MSAAPAPAAAAEGDAPKKGSKKLIIIIAAVAVLLLGGGGAAFFIMKKKAAEAEAAAEGGEAADDHGGHGGGKVAKKPEHGGGKKDDHAAPPTFVPLDSFVVNLADKEAERYAQIGVTLQVEDPHMGDEIKAYMPAIRNAVLLILSHKTSEQLLSQDGKTELAEEIRREAARAMGYQVEDPEEEDDAPKKKKKKKRVEIYNPIVNVKIGRAHV